MKPILRVLLLVALITTLAMPAFAQGNCSYGWIVDETGRLDTAAICEAMKPWTYKGIQVLVYYTDKSYSNEDAWFAQLDQTEQVIPDRVNMFAVEGRTDGIVTVNRGDYLFYNTNLGQDARVDEVKGRFQTAGNVTDGFVGALNYAFDVAFPALVVQPTEAPRPTSVPPTPAPPTATPVPLFTPEEARQATNAVIGFILFVAVAAGGAVLAYFVGYKRLWPYYLRLRHLEEVRDRVTRLLNGVAKLVAGDTVEATMLYSLLSAYGVKTYDKMDEEVHEWIRRSQAAVAEAFRLHTLLRRDQGKKLPLERVIQAWEMIYITLVGTTREILDLTDEQMRQLLNPTEEVVTEGADVQLVQQLRDLTREIAGGGVKITLTVVDPLKVDSAGVLGYLKKAKEQLAELRRAKLEAEPTVKNAKEARGGTVARPFPAGLTVADALKEIDTLLVAAETDLAGRLYLSAMRRAEDALEMIVALEKVLPEVLKASQALAQAQAAYVESGNVPPRTEVFRRPVHAYTSALGAIKAAKYDQAAEDAGDVMEFVNSVTTIVAGLLAAIAKHEKRMTRLAAIKTAGYRPPFYDTLLAEVADDHNRSKAALTEGDYAEADAFVRELEKDSVTLLEKSEALVALCTKNVADLGRLSTEAARVEKYRTEVQKAWETLRAYPTSNWTDVGKYFDIATRILAGLFDDPANERDLASAIGRLNGFDEQQFAKAEAELVNAFVQLRDAEEKLKALKARLELVQQAERTAASTLAAAKADLNKAAELRDREDRLIDATVDDKIKAARRLVSQAEAKITGREFFEAQRMFTEARELSRTAAAESEAQARTLNALLARFQSARGTASERVSRAQTDQAYLKPSAQKASTAGKIGRAADLLRKAKAADAETSSLEDTALAAAVENSIRLYTEATQIADEAIRQVASDKAEYDGYFQAAEQAVRAATQAISDAGKKVADSDAGGAGSSSLTRAKNEMPSPPAYGTTTDALLRAQQAAQTARQCAENAEAEAKRKIAAVEAERKRIVAVARAEAVRRAAEETRRSSYTSSVVHRTTTSPTTHRSTSSPTVHRSSPSPSVHRSSSSGGSHRR